jgi:hypothetical protein
MKKIISTLFAILVINSTQVFALHSNTAAQAAHEKQTKLNDQIKHANEQLAALKKESVDRHAKVKAQADQNKAQTKAAHDAIRKEVKAAKASLKDLYKQRAAAKKEERKALKEVHAHHNTTK